MNFTGRALLLAWTIAFAAPALAEEAPSNPPDAGAPPGNAPVPSPSPDSEPEVTIAGERPASEAASRVSYTGHELELRPRLRPGDVVEAVPGLFAVQHAGGGKANQYFLRGFDADHGTDVAFFVDGVPVNLPSHGHGQGYSDLHFLIPELVVSLDGYKGPYYAALGDFATAGAVNLRLAETFDESYAAYTVGQYGIQRGLVVESPKLGEDWSAILAAEVYTDDGPFENPEGLNRFNVYARATRNVGTSGKLSATWMSYGSSWHGSGQIPARAVCGEGEPENPPPAAYGEPCIDHFGYVDPSEGGDTQRHMLSLAYSASSNDTDVSALAYLVRYRFSLYSNFTFFGDDPARGDEIEQDDDRTVLGTDFRVKRHVRLGAATLSSTLGLQVRTDGIDNALYHDAARERLEPRVSAHVAESDIGVFAEEDARLARWLRVVVGLRGERIDVNVDDRLEDTGRSGTKTSGIKGAALLMPKAMLVLSPAPALDLFADVGRGFHSNDARGAVLGTNAATLMTSAWGYEAGARVSPLPGLVLQAAAFILDLDSELVWEGDAGTTSPAGRTRRVGAELGARYRIGSWLFADADATFTRARYRENAGNAEAVALAPTRTFTAGFGVRHALGPVTPFGALRVKSIAERPADETNTFTAEGFTVLDADAGLRWKDVEAS
ncbi:MAG TPA: TonB-dependent receptor, partial [Polyangiaceae bacterium]|nr:TonB-dependent receptor [Polyangiaceae bacterium]